MNNVDLLRPIPLFEGMTDHSIEVIASLADEINFADGDALMREGDPGETFYIVVDGRLRVSRSGVTIREQGPGDFLGEISLIDGRPRTATATAVGPVTTLAIDRHAFLSLIEEHPAVRLSVLMALTERIRRDEREAVV